MAIVELVYVSKSVKRMTQQDLEQLLAEARSFNDKNQITGLLLYDGYGTFVQALEGEEHQVLSLYAKIAADKRHGQLVKLGHHQISSRSFPDWSMGFRTFDTQTLAGNKGCRELLEQWERGEIAQVAHSFAYEMIHHFATEHHSRG